MLIKKTYNMRHGFDHSLLKLKGYYEYLIIYYA